MKRYTSKLFAALGLFCIIVPFTGLAGCSKKEVPVPNANPNNNADEGKGAMPGNGPDKK